MGASKALVLYVYIDYIVSQLLIGLVIIFGKC